MPQTSFPPHNRGGPAAHLLPVTEDDLFKIALLSTVAAGVPGCPRHAGQRRGGQCASLPVSHPTHHPAPKRAAEEAPSPFHLLTPTPCLAGPCAGWRRAGAASPGTMRGESSACDWPPCTEKAPYPPDGASSGLSERGAPVPARPRGGASGLSGRRGERGTHRRVRPAGKGAGMATLRGRDHRGEQARSVEKKKPRPLLAEGAGPGGVRRRCYGPRRPSGR